MPKSSSPFLTRHLSVKHPKEHQHRACRFAPRKVVAFCPALKKNLLDVVCFPAGFLLLTWNRISSCRTPPFPFKWVPFVQLQSTFQPIVPCALSKTQSTHSAVPHPNHTLQPLQGEVFVGPPFPFSFNPPTQQCRIPTTPFNHCKGKFLLVPLFPFRSFAKYLSTTPRGSGNFGLTA